MGIKRFFANKDNTITNAYKSNLRHRGTGSNQGASDILEIFSLYGQTIDINTASGSQELSRLLVQFPVSGTAAGEIKAARTNGDIPISGSVSFYLRLFNAKHSQTVPKSLEVNVMAVSQSWSEGTGMDMEEYNDLGASNWLSSSSTSTKATLVDAINVSGVAQNDEFTMTVPTIAGGDGVTYKFLFDSGTDVEANEEANTFGISLTSVSDDADAASVLVKAINGVADNKYKYGAANLGAGSALAAGTIGLTAAIGSSTTKITLTMDNDGAAGNVANVLAASTGFANDLLLESSFTGGSGPWANLGGDYHSSSYTAANGTMPSYNYTFAEGTEDLEVDVTSLVEEWIAGTQENYGFGVFLTSAQEAYHSSSTGLDANNLLHNTAGAKDSFYTKKFFGRGTQFFFKKPALEARWDSADKDNRGNFYYSSSLAPASNNTQTLFLYNYVDGQLTNIPSTSNIYVQMFSGTTAPAGNPISLAQGDYVASNNLYIVTGGLSAKTGIYTASFAMTASATALETIYDVWGAGNAATAAGTIQTTQFFTGSFSPSRRVAKQENTLPKYRSSVSNLKDSYSVDENARFRVTIKESNKTPTVYTKAVASVPSEIIENGYFSILRVYDNHVIIPFGTGSSNNEYTRMSYDVSGNYFDLDIGTFESGYQYAIKLAYYLDNRYIEQNEIFKFKVE